MTLGLKLKLIRLQKGYSQKTLAQKLSLSSQTISKWENNWAYPNIKNLLLLSELYHISLNDLLNEDTFIFVKPLQNQSYLLVNSSLFEIIALLIVSFISLKISVFGIFISLGMIYWLKKNPSYPFYIIIINIILGFYNLLYSFFFIIHLFL